jgi:hypothetical protein
MRRNAFLAGKRECEKAIQKVEAQQGQGQLLGFAVLADVGKYPKEFRQAVDPGAGRRPGSPAAPPGYPCGSFLAPRLTTGFDGGGTTGPMSPSGAWSRSTITGAWSLGPRPLRA